MMERWNRGTIWKNRVVFDNNIDQIEICFE